MIKKLKVALSIVLLTASITANAVNYAGISGLAFGALTTFIGVATGTAIVATGGLALLAVGGVMLLNFDGSQPSSSSSAAISIQLDPNTPLTTPAGWTAPVSPSKQPTPPPNAPHDYYDMGAYGSSNTKEGACALLSQYGYSVAPDGLSCLKNDGYTHYYWTASKVCDTGTLSSDGSTCGSAGNSQAKPIMNQETIVRTGNSFAIDPQINPADILPERNIKVTPQHIEINASDSSQTTVDINADGTTTIKTTKPKPSTNDTQVDTSVFSAPTPTEPPKLIGKKTETTTGQGVSATPAQSGAPLDISSLNKEATQQGIKTGIDTLHKDLNCDNCTLPTDKTEEQKSNIQAEIKKTTDSLTHTSEDYENFKNLGWSTWLPSFPSSSCSPFTKQIAGQTVTWDFCPYVSKLNETIGWLMALFSAWTITGLFFNRD